MCLCVPKLWGRIRLVVSEAKPNWWEELVGPAGGPCGCQKFRRVQKIEARLWDCGSWARCCSILLRNFVSSMGDDAVMCSKTRDQKVVGLKVHLALVRAETSVASVACAAEPASKVPDPETVVGVRSAEYLEGFFQAVRSLEYEMAFTTSGHLTGDVKVWWAARLPDEMRTTRGKGKRTSWGSS